MDNKKILIVCKSFYPDESPRSYRATELAKELKRQGNHVTVMCPQKDKLEDFLQKWGIEYVSLGVLRWNPICFNCKFKFLYILERILHRFMSLGFDYPNVELYFKIKKSLSKNKNFYDALISIAVPYAVHWGVASIWKKKDTNNPARIWIADCGDPFYGQENDSFKLPFYWAWVEKWFMRKTDYVTVPTSTSYLGYFGEFHNKIKVISQGFKFEDYQFENKTKNNEVPVFAYAGLFIPGRRDPSLFCQYLLETKNDFRFHIYTRNSDLVQDFQIKHPDKFIIHKFIPRMNLLEKLKSEIDFVINFENAGQIQTPSKLIDYILIDKPILSVKSLELDKNAVNEFLNFNFSKKLIIENSDQYRIENVTSKFLELIK
jgi:hypothetical protein